jgi:hypothetical protein
MLTDSKIAHLSRIAAGLNALHHLSEAFLEADEENDGAFDLEAGDGFYDYALAILKSVSPACLHRKMQP